MLRETGILDELEVFKRNKEPLKFKDHCMDSTRMKSTCTNISYFDILWFPCDGSYPTKFRDLGNVYN